MIHRDREDRAHLSLPFSRAHTHSATHRSHRLHFLSCTRQSLASHCDALSALHVSDGAKGRLPLEGFLSAVNLSISLDVSRESTKCWQYCIVHAACPLFKLRI